MSKAFDMALFLSGVLNGSPATRARHLRQAMVIQIAIIEHWNLDNPWTWKRKHMVWFLESKINSHAESTRHYYLLTIKLLTTRLKKKWSFNKQPNSARHKR